MRWVARIFANAVARRVAALLVMAVLAWVGIGSARAQSCTEQSPCDQGAAYSAAASRAAAFEADRNATSGWTDWKGKVSGPHSLSAELAYYQCYAERPVTGTVGCTGGNPLGRYYYGKNQTCDKKPSQSTLFLPPGGSTRCNSGCEQKYTWMGADSQGRETTMADYTGNVCDPNKGKDECNAKNPGGTTPPSWVWNGYLGVCQPINTECPEGQKSTPDGKCTNNDDCPITHVLNASGVCVKKGEECPAGMTTGIDGLCTADNDKNKCPTGQAKGKDGTCKPDKNNDGIPDSDQDPDDPNNNEDGKQFSGGDSCNVPPNCAGDPIMCGQARIQWRIDCNTRKQANISGGMCSSMPVCTGDGCKPMEYQQLLMQWRTACAVEKLAKGGMPSDGSGEGNGTVPNPDTSGVGDGVLEGALGEHGEGDPDGAFTDGSEGGAPGGQPGGTPGSDGLDTQGYGWSRSCPTPPAVDLLGATITFDIGPFCNWMTIGGWLVLIMASLLSVRIMASGGSA